MSLLASILCLLAFSAHAAPPYVMVLGIAQDGGVPHAGCEKSCCAQAGGVAQTHHRVSSIAIIDPESQQRWLVDATPDFPSQLATLDAIAPNSNSPMLDGIFLTHAHIGHYTGLMHLGREVMGAKHIPVYGMPRMEQFLTHNGPWDQLVQLENIEIRPLEDKKWVHLNDRLSVQPFLVPHRDEYSETVGFKIKGPQRTLVFLPDVDKWDKMDKPITTLLKEVDIALLDGTFFGSKELPGRDIKEVPHPFIVESLETFKTLKPKARSGIYFIHLNHTNPALDPESDASKQIVEKGFRVAKDGDSHPL